MEVVFGTVVVVVGLVGWWAGGVASDALDSPVGCGEVVIRGVFLPLSRFINCLDDLEQFSRTASETGSNDRLGPGGVPCDGAILILNRELVGISGDGGRQRSVRVERWRCKI